MTLPDNKMINKPRILLHCCCAPCASYVLECLIPDYSVTLLFYNPNIEPQEEYIKRQNEAKKLLKKMSLESVVEQLECGYGNAAFADAVLSLRDEPEGGKRCRICFKLRLEETARRAAAGEYDIFATTLSVSPHKNAKQLNEIGSEASGKYNIKYLSSDFKKNNGYLRSVELSKAFGLYRQEYCGCNRSGGYNRSGGCIQEDPVFG